MPKGHFESAGASIEYGDAGCLFPVDELGETVRQYRDAQLALDDVGLLDDRLIAAHFRVAGEDDIERALFQQMRCRTNQFLTEPRFRIGAR